MEFGTHLLIILIVAWVFGHVAETAKLPASVGQVVAGIAVALVGDALAPAIHLLDGIATSPSIKGVGEAGIFILMLYAGIEMKPSEISHHGSQSIAVAVGGAAIPLASGFALAWYVLPESDVRSLQAFVVGVALSITAIAVAVKVFMDFDLLHHEIGRTVIAAALFDDIIGLVLLGLLTSMIVTGILPGTFEIGMMLGKVCLFFVATWLVGHRLSDPFWLFIDRFHMPGIRIMALLAIALVYGLFAEVLGLHFILGPFMAGLYFEPQSVGREAFAGTERSVNAITKGVLGPVFFASIGLTVDVSALVEVPGFVLALLVVAMLGKLIGCGLPAYLLNGHNLRDAAAIGIGMSGRGAVELFVVSIAYQSGVFQLSNGNHPILENLYSALILTAIVTTALTPALLRLALYHRKN